MVPGIDKRQDGWFNDSGVDSHTSRPRFESGIDPQVKDDTQGRIVQWLQGSTHTLSGPRFEPGIIDKMIHKAEWFSMAHRLTCKLSGQGSIPVLSLSFKLSRDTRQDGSVSHGSTHSLPDQGSNPV